METFAPTALERLRALTGDPAAEFRAGQLEAIRDVVVDRARVLCVQRTGWGKSAVYFVATALLREAGRRADADRQPAAGADAQPDRRRRSASACGRTRSTRPTATSGTACATALADGTVDLLLISPERLNNPRFRDEMLPLFAASVGLLVIDEAHCISDWGHDFRPDYRRVKDMLDALAPDVAVLGTTATANDRVVADVSSSSAHREPAAALLPRSAGPDEPAAGGRSSCRSRPSGWRGWSRTCPRLTGSGIVYTLTKRDAEQVAEFLTANGVTALAYSGEQDTDERIATEERLLRNEVKAVVATSALGMGYDKADLTFVVHYQAPGSVVSYYQQVGRAGRGVEHADVVLLRGGEDKRIQDFFIEQAFPVANASRRCSASSSRPEPKGARRAS